jgi:hypothetical protein
LDHPHIIPRGRNMYPFALRRAGGAPVLELEGVALEEI